MHTDDIAKLKKNLETLTVPEKNIFREMLNPLLTLVEIAKNLDLEHGYVRQVASTIYDKLYAEVKVFQAVDKRKRRENLFIPNPIFIELLGNDFFEKKDT